MPKYTQSEPRKTYFVEPGEYAVEIFHGELKLSQAGNEMIKLKCRVALPDGGEGPEVHEHLTFTAKAAWKVDQVREACGFAVVPGEEVDVQPEHFIGKTARVVLGEEPGDSGHRFNTLERWVSPKAPAAKPAPKTSPAEADEIPF
jgi:hypothetical protein